MMLPGSSRRCFELTSIVMYNRAVLLKIVMIKTNDAIIGGISEIRANFPELVVNIKNGKVIVTKRGVPVAVIQSYQSYEEMEKLAEKIENQELMRIALARDTENAKWISEEKMKKWLLAQ